MKFDLLDFDTYSRNGVDPYNLDHILLRYELIWDSNSRILPHHLRTFIMKYAIFRKLNRFRLNSLLTSGYKNKYWNVCIYANFGHLIQSLMMRHNVSMTIILPFHLELKYSIWMYLVLKKWRIWYPRKFSIFILMILIPPYNILGRLRLMEREPC